MVDNEWMQGLDEEDQFVARIVGAESEEDYEAIPLSVRNAWRNTYRNIEDKEQSLESLRKAGVIDEDIYNSAKAAGYDGENLSDITPEQWREIYNDYIKGYNSFAAEHPDVPYRFRNQERYRAQWDKSYGGYTGKQNEQNVKPAQSTANVTPQEETEQEESQEEATPLEVDDVPNKPFPEANQVEAKRVQPIGVENKPIQAQTQPQPQANQPKQVTLPEEEQEEYRRNGGIFDIARQARNEEPQQEEQTKQEEQAQREENKPTESATEEKKDIGYTPVAPWQTEEKRENKGTGYGYNIFDELKETRREEENPTQTTPQQTTPQQTTEQVVTQPQSNAKLPEEEQQEYVDNGGVMPIAGTNNAKALQKRNGNVTTASPQRENNNVTPQPSVNENAGQSANSVPQTQEVTSVPQTNNNDDGEPYVTPVESRQTPKVVEVVDNTMRPRTTPVDYEKIEEEDNNLVAGKSQTTTNGSQKRVESKPATSTQSQSTATATTKPQHARANQGSSVDEDKYRGFQDIIDEYRRKADEEESKYSAEDRARMQKAAKRRMLLSGIADAANAFHKAYSYARGVKPMSDGSYSDKAKKEIREDLDWLNKNEDRVLNARAKVAELEMALQKMKYNDKALEARNKEYERRVKKDEETAAIAKLKTEAYSEYQKAQANKNNEMAAYWKAKWEALEAGRSKEEALTEAKTAKENAAANAYNALAEQRRNSGSRRKVKHIERDDSGDIVKEWYEYEDDVPAGNDKDNTPPSRQPKNNNSNDNTPPSRQKK